MPSISKLLRVNTDVICELALERREVSNNLANLENDIESNQKEVSEHNKEVIMSELKAIHAYTFDEVEVISNRSNGDDYYLKSEADKLIAELNIRICDGDEDFEIANNQIKRLLEIVRHQKYKRCLNNAWWCLREEFFAEDCRCERWVDWSIKWHKRWIELAEKFKEEKCR